MAENEEGRRRRGSLFASLPSFGASEKEGGQFTAMLQGVSKQLIRGLVLKGEIFRLKGCDIVPNSERFERKARLCIAAERRRGGVRCL